MIDGAADISDLVRRARASDREAFTLLYRETMRPVYRYCAARLSTREDAEEVTQEVFMAALEGIQRLRTETEAGFFAWLYQIARNKVADRLRGRYRQRGVSLDGTHDPASDGPSPLQALVRSESVSEVREALEQLTPDQRDVVLCKYILGYDNVRTAAIVGKNANAVNQLHHRALNTLRRILGDEAQLT